jgi:hypothetical protein
VQDSRLATSQRRLEEATKEFTSAYLRAEPVEGTQLGFTGEHDSRLPPGEPRERADLIAELTTAAHKLRAASDESTSVDDRIDGELAEIGIRAMRIVEDGLRPYGRNPAVYLDGFIRGVYSLLMRTDLSVAEGVEPLAARLRAQPRFNTARRRVTAPRACRTNDRGRGGGARLP